MKFSILKSIFLLLALFPSPVGLEKSFGWRSTISIVGGLKEDWSLIVVSNATTLPFMIKEYKAISDAGYKPHSIGVGDGSEAKDNLLLDQTQRDCEIKKLIKYENCWCARTDPQEGDRIERKTTIETKRERIAPKARVKNQLCHWISPDDRQSALRKRISDCMKERHDDNWPCNLDKVIFSHIPSRNEIISYGRGYGGNPLLEKKCFSLHIGSKISQREGGLTLYILILGITNPEVREKYIAASFPTLTMNKPTLPKWKVESVGDDFSWMKRDSHLRTIHTEKGFFGSVPETSVKTNPYVLKTCSANYTGKEILQDHFDVQPFISCNFEKYQAHWIGLNQICGNMQEIFGLNWFQKIEIIKFMFTWVGENSPVLEKIFNRIDVIDGYFTLGKYYPAGVSLHLMEQVYMNDIFSFPKHVWTRNGRNWKIFQ